MASRLGTRRMLGRLPKLLRIRFFSVNEYVIVFLYLESCTVTRSGLRTGWM